MGAPPPGVKLRTGQCDVCFWSRKDATPKLTRYCGACGAWICSSCWYNLPDRTWAMFMSYKQQLQEWAKKVKRDVFSR